MPSAEVSPAPSRVVLRNSAYNAAGFVWSAGVLFFQVTWLLAKLGPEQYGLWSLAIAVSSQVGLLDFGFGSTLVRFVAAARGRGDEREIGRIVTNAVLVYAGVALVVLLLWPAVPWLLDILRVPAGLHETGSFVVRWSIVNLALSTVLINLFLGVLHGIQRMDVTNRIGIAAGVPRVLGLIVVVQAGWGLRGVVLLELGVTLLSFLAAGLAMFRLLPGLRLRARDLSGRTMRELFRFGLLLQTSVLAGLVSFHADKMLLSRYAGLTVLAFYDLGARVAGKVRGLPLIAFSSLLPAFAAAERDRGKLRAIYLISSRVVTAAVVPLFTVLALAAGPLIGLWLGPGHELTIVSLRVLALAYACNVLTVVASNAAQGMGRPGIIAAASAVQVAVGFSLSLFLLRSIGFSGLLIGTSPALYASALLLVLQVNRALRVPARAYLRDVLRLPLAYSLAGAAVGAGVVVLLDRAWPQRGRPGEAAALAAVAVSYLVPYALCLVRGSYLDRAERERLRAGVRGLLGREAHAG